MQAFSFKITCLLSDAMEIINIRNFWFDFVRKEFPLIVDETGAQKHAISRFSLMWQSYFNVHTFVTTKQHEKVAEKNLNFSGTSIVNNQFNYNYNQHHCVLNVIFGPSIIPFSLLQRNQNSTNKRYK